MAVSRSVIEGREVTTDELEAAEAIGAVAKSKAKLVKITPKQRVSFI